MDIETRIAELRAEQSALRGLENNLGWKSWMEGITAAATTRRNMVFEVSMQGLDDAFTATKLKGEIMGLLTAKDWVFHRLEDIKTDLERAIAEEGEEWHETEQKKQPQPSP